MPLNLPETAEIIINRAKNDVRTLWLGSNPFLKNSVLGAITTSFANRVFDLVLNLKEAIRQTFADTATDDFLVRHASIRGINRLAATIANGNIVATGVDAASITIGSVWVASDGTTYTSTSTVAVTATTLSVTSITRVGNLATVTTTTDHLLASNVEVTISGAAQVDYNGATAIIVLSATQFTFAVANNPTTPATGTILADHTSIQVPLDSDAFQDSENGVNVNQVLDTALSVQAPITDVDDTANVDFGEIGGGTDQENDIALRERLLFRIRNPIANFNDAAIIDKAKEINGVTRVFVFDATPLPGQVTINFMRDNDVDPIPSAGEVTTVKNKILEIKPAQAIDADVIVAALVAVPTAYTFSALEPNTTGMQTAVSANLAVFYAEDPIAGTDIFEEQFIAAIQNTIAEGGIPIVSFTLSAPTADITIVTGEIGTLGTVTYP